MPSVCLSVVLSLLAATLIAQTPAVDPEQLLASHFQFTARDVGQVRQGQPVVKVQADGAELALTGAIKLPGRKERLSEWLKNIEHFRSAAELGTAHAFTLPAGPEAFAGVPGDTPALRRTLAGRTTAYVAQGNSDDTRSLVAKAATAARLAPALTAYLEHHPASRPDGIDERFYWSAMTVGSDPIVAVHHLVFYRRDAGEAWIADVNIYSTKYFDAAVLGIALYDSPDGNGFYAIAGSRMRSSQLSRPAAAALRRQIQRSASDSVKMYLEWLRDSLSAAAL